ncbi:hypothetical protein ABPG77_001421 [Micractinium sp. CCAP 211/92]
MGGQNGSAAPRAKPEAFPPRWVGSTLKLLITWIRLSAMALVLSGASMGLKYLLEAHESGVLVPAVQSWAQHPVTLPTGVLACVTLAVLLVVHLVRRRTQPIYLLDFECFRPEDSLKVTYNRFVTGSRDSGFFDDESMDFQTRILHKSGLSEETFFPPGLHKDPPEFDMVWARQEAELVMFNAVADLLAKTGLKPRQIDVLVVNCSLFNPTPSLSAMIINHFKMRSDIDSFNLGGMGCSAGMISIDLAKKMLRERGRGGYALVVSTENITQNWWAVGAISGFRAALAWIWAIQSRVHFARLHCPHLPTFALVTFCPRRYHGIERSMLIPNTIFRMGSAAILLTNKRSERRRAKYELQHVVRVHLGSDDTAYQCVFQRPDARNFIGVELSKDLVGVAAKALETNMTRLGPLVLPWSEKLMFAANWVARKVLRLRVPRYIPDFKEAFDHFCLHVGGRGVVEGLSKQLGLNPRQMAPSANTLHWYGNTSSSTVWYSFGYIESVQGVRKGDIVWQVGFGSGFKCNSVVWRALRNVKTMHKAWEHIRGREEQAMETLRRIAAETAAERQLKQQKENGVQENGHVNGHVKSALKQAAFGADAVVHVGAGRSLRNGKVIPN